MRKNKWYRLRAGNLPLTSKGRIARKMEKFIKRNGLYQFHYITRNGDKLEYIDYYPILYYMKCENNEFRIRIRIDGTNCSEKFRNMEQALSDLFQTICTNILEERGYLTYCFEIKRQEQKRIVSCRDITKIGETEIAFSNLTWNWKKCPHLLLIGNTGSGKTSILLLEK